MDYVINTGDIVYYLRNSDLVGVVTNTYFSGDGTFRKIPYATVSWFTDIQLPKNLSVLSLTRITKAEIQNDWLEWTEGEDENTLKEWKTEEW